MEADEQRLNNYRTNARPSCHISLALGSCVRQRVADPIEGAANRGRETLHRGNRAQTHQSCDIGAKRSALISEEMGCSSRRGAAPVSSCSTVFGTLLILRHVYRGLSTYTAKASGAYLGRIVCASERLAFRESIGGRWGLFSDHYQPRRLDALEFPAN